MVVFLHGPALADGALRPRVDRPIVKVVRGLGALFLIAFLVGNVAYYLSFNEPLEDTLDLLVMGVLFPGWVVCLGLMLFFQAPHRETGQQPTARLEE